MADYVWVCKTCGHESGAAWAVLDHRERSGHVGGAVRFNREDRPRTDLPPPAFRRDLRVDGGRWWIAPRG
jgi:hypothetical protein